MCWRHVHHHAATNVENNIMFMRCGEVSSHTSCQHAAAVATPGPQHMATSQPPSTTHRGVPRGVIGASCVFSSCIILMSLGNKQFVPESAAWRCAQTLRTAICPLAWAHDHLVLSLCRLPRKRASRRHRCVSLRPPSYGPASCRVKQAMTMANITPEPHKHASRASPRTGGASVRGPSAISRLKTEPV